MYVLKEHKCERCGGSIIVFPFTEKSEVVVDYGACEYCGKIEILPSENYRRFVAEFCERK